jgi:hypothetical protein
MVCERQQPCCASKDCRSGLPVQDEALKYRGEIRLLRRRKIQDQSSVLFAGFAAEEFGAFQTALNTIHNYGIRLWPDLAAAM